MVVQLDTMGKIVLIFALKTVEEREHVNGKQGHARVDARQRGLGNSVYKVIYCQEAIYSAITF